MRTLLFSFLALLGGATFQAAGNSVLPLALNERAAAADAICRGKVAAITAFRRGGGRIWTQVSIDVLETLKGRLPPTVHVIHRGGRLNGAGESTSELPRLTEAEERLFFLKRRSDGTLFIDNGPAGAVPLGGSALGRVLLDQLRALTGDGADFSDNQPSVVARQVTVLGGLLTHSGTGRPYRFLSADRGEPIEYIVDMDALPTGISTNAALTAVSNAFKAWSDVTSLSFRFLGMQSFGTAPGNVSTNDGRIRVALHDLYGTISSSSTLGVGGASFTYTESAGGDGGAINGNKFHLSTKGQLVMKHTQQTLQDPVSFEEVLGHEIGHVLGMDHSSETDPESDGMKAEALMYFQVHADGRGARLNDLDKQIIVTAYPTNNTPPVSFDRVMDVVTDFSGQNPAVNRVQLLGFDLQGTALTPSIFSQSGTNFAIEQGFLTVNFGGAVGDSPRTDPLGSQAYARAKITFSDGTNDSPFAEVRVVSIHLDRVPSASDGMPDSWMTQYFGTTDPSGNPLHAATADFDGDGINNLDEFRAGTDPTDRNSALQITSGAPTQGITFASRPGDLYQIDFTSDFTNWVNATLPFVAQTTNDTVTNLSNVTGNSGFFRLRRLP